jgi:hypothetical protein
MTIGSLHYIWRSAVLFYSLYSRKGWDEYSIGVYIIWAVMTLVAFPSMLFVLQMFYYHSILAINGLTTLEHMKGNRFKNPCSYYPAPVNIFDYGTIGNFLRFFGDSYFSWFLPTSIKYPNDATYFQNNAVVLSNDFTEKKNKENPDKLREYYTNGGFDVAGKVEEAYKFCDGKHMQLNEQMFEWQG